MSQSRFLSQQQDKVETPSSSLPKKTNPMDSSDSPNNNIPSTTVDTKNTTASGNVMLSHSPQQPSHTTNQSYSSNGHSQGYRRTDFSDDNDLTDNYPNSNYVTHTMNSHTSSHHSIYSPQLIRNGVNKNHRRITEFRRTNNGNANGNTSNMNNMNNMNNNKNNMFRPGVVSSRLGLIGNEESDAAIYGDDEGAGQDDIMYPGQSSRRGLMTSHHSSKMRQNGARMKQFQSTPIMQQQKQYAMYGSNRNNNNNNNNNNNHYPGRNSNSPSPNLWNMGRGRNDTENENVKNGSNSRQNLFKKKTKNAENVSNSNNNNNNNNHNNDETSHSGKSGKRPFGRLDTSGTIHSRNRGKIGGGQRWFSASESRRNVGANRYYTDTGTNPCENFCRMLSLCQQYISKCCHKCCHCDVENLFEWTEIFLLSIFVVFIILWWATDEDDTLLTVLAIFMVLWTVIILNMRRSHASLRCVEFGVILNDFRIILFTISVVLSIIVCDFLLFEYNLSDNAQQETNREYKSGYLWITHTVVWIVGALCWMTLDFAAYMSYCGRLLYPIVMLVSALIEIIESISKLSRIDKRYFSNEERYERHHLTLIRYKNGIYTVYDLKIDGLMLIILIVCSSLFIYFKDRYRQYNCFGRSRVSRDKIMTLILFDSIYQNERNNKTKKNIYNRNRNEYQSRNNRYSNNNNNNNNYNNNNNKYNRQYSRNRDYNHNSSNKNGHGSRYTRGGPGYSQRAKRRKAERARGYYKHNNRIYEDNEQMAPQTSFRSEVLDDSLYDERNQGSKKLRYKNEYSRSGRSKTKNNNNNNNNNSNNVDRTPSSKGLIRNAEADTRRGSDGRKIRGRQLSIDGKYDGFDSLIDDISSYEDSVFICAIINLSIIFYLSFFAWDTVSEYKVIATCVFGLCMFILLKKDGDFNIIVSSYPRLITQSHFIYCIFGLILISIVMIYEIYYLELSNDNIKYKSWKFVFSVCINYITLTLCVIFLICIDCFQTMISTHFLIRASLCIMFMGVCICNIIHITFDDNYGVSQLSASIAGTNVYFLPILGRCGYYILFTMACCSFHAWIKDPYHKYFVFIHEMRKKHIRTLLTLPKSGTTNANTTGMMGAANPMIDYNNDSGYMNQNNMHHYRGGGDPQANVYGNYNYGYNHNYYYNPNHDRSNNNNMYHGGPGRGYGNGNGNGNGNIPSGHYGYQSRGRPMAHLGGFGGGGGGPRNDYFNDMGDREINDHGRYDSPGAPIFARQQSGPAFRYARPGPGMRQQYDPYNRYGPSRQYNNYRQY